MLIINGMMRSVKYMAILGLVSLCMFIAPAMAVDIAACDKCTPETKPEIRTVCPAACIIAFDEDYWTYDGADLARAAVPLPSASPLSGETIKEPTINLMESKLSGHNVESDLKKAVLY
jgi:hypothetical protein